LAEILQALAGPEGFIPPTPDALEGARKLIAATQALQPPVQQTVPLAQPAGGAFGTQMPQEIAPATTAGSLVSAPLTMANVLTGAYGGLEEMARHNIEASSRQEVDPAAAKDAALLVMGATPFGMAGKAALGSGPLSFSERMARAQDVAFLRAQRGTATGDYGLGTARRTAPEAPKGSFEDFAARQQQGFKNDTATAIDQYREATGQPRTGEARPLLAPGETPEDLARGFEFGAGAKDKRAGAALIATSEATPAGEQFVLPGAERATDATMAQRLTDAALKPGVAQKPADEGLFAGPDKQGTLFSGASDKRAGAAIEAYDFLHGARPDAPFPQFAERYPDIGPPTMKLKTGESEGGATYPAKTLTPEAQQVAKARLKIQEEMDREGYQPFFDPSQRFPAAWEQQPGPHVDTAMAVAKRQETLEKHLKTIGAEETLANLRKGYSRGLDLADSQAFYHMGQVEQKMMQDMGAEAGRKHFRDTIATGMAATTSGQTPASNLMMTHYLNYLRKTGQPFPTEAHQTPVGVGGERTMPNIRAYQELFSDPRGPYEALGLENPKRTDFAQAQMGNPNAFTIDEQMGHGMIQKDVPAKGTYGLVTNVGRQEAARMGEEPARVQDVGWAGFKKLLEDAQRAKKGLRPYGPGEGYQGQPEIAVINDQIERQHRLTGMPRQKIWERLYLNNEIPAYAVGGLTLGGVLQSQMNPATPLE
jgi:hypothetical protein